MNSNEGKEKLDKRNKNEILKKKNDKKVLYIVFAIICIIIIGGIIIYVKSKEDECNNNGYNSEMMNINEKLIEITTDKPIIYLYPEKTTGITVKLKYPEKIICSYPKYENGWNVIANPDGTLINTENGKSLYSLYWEGIGSATINMDKGFVVKGNEVVEFLEQKLAILGLTEREAEEFIIYWLPKLESNQYNYIRFATIDEINEYMPLEFSVQPDTLIRVLMQFKALNEYREVQEQILTAPERKGFVVVEWGGIEI